MRIKGGTGGANPLKFTKIMRFSAILVWIPWKIKKAIKPEFNLETTLSSPTSETPFLWRFASWPMMVRFVIWILRGILSSIHQLNKMSLELDPLWQNFPDPRMLCKHSVFLSKICTIELLSLYKDSAYSVTNITSIVLTLVEVLHWALSLSKTPMTQAVAFASHCFFRRGSMSETSGVGNFLKSSALTVFSPLNLGSFAKYLWAAMYVPTWNRCFASTYSKTSPNMHFRKKNLSVILPGFVNGLVNDDGSPCGFFNVSPQNGGISWHLTTPTNTVTLIIIYLNSGKSILFHGRHYFQLQKIPQNRAPTWRHI